MRTITNEEHQRLLKYHCLKGKHEPYENSFGVTWCVLCGALLKDVVPSDKNTHLPINNYEPIKILCV